MYDIDIPRTELLINSIIAGMAILGTIISLVVVGLQIRHQNHLESKRVEHEYVRDLLKVIDKPLDLALSNLMEVEYLRAAEPAALKDAESLHRARPTLMTDSRNAYQVFTNVASTLTTVLPACRRRRGITADADRRYLELKTHLINLVELYENVSGRYGNTAELVKMRIAAYENDQIIAKTTAVLAAVRFHASALLADLYVPRDHAA